MLILNHCEDDEEYWSKGKNNRGFNQVGHLLMHLRREFQLDL